MFGRVIAFLYGLICYIIFLIAFLYAIGFVGNVVVPKNIDSGRGGPLGPALIIDTVLLSLFALQHSIMARQWFKRAWTKIVPEPVERSTYVLLASLILLLLFWQWRPMKAIVWDVHGPNGRAVLHGLYWLGWGLVFASTYLIDHFGLFGMKQVYNYLLGKRDEPPPFKTPTLYKIVRHPLYLGFIIAFWSTPRMTAGHLFFALMTTAYILVAIQFEERDLIRFYGDSYRKYRGQVSMLFPLRLRKRP
ncbi:MAG TPA: isoprenylcysteine carboxylmethyltransferase family protein [Chthoniobacterales bacterium]|nr:isoprenylcysteine carboxylmethyltransferase family protein [Chthoniobacterales bacterium]